MSGEITKLLIHYFTALQSPEPALLAGGEGCGLVAGEAGNA